MSALELVSALERVAAHRAHARHALRRLEAARHDDRIRRPGHGTERTTAREWRRAKRALRKARALGLEIARAL